MAVELVNVQTSDGIRLDGALQRTDKESQLGVDLVIFHHGLGGSFYPPNMAAALSDYLATEGCSVLRVNNRGHDHMYASPQGWLGSGFEIVDDFRFDCRAWMGFAESAGFQRIGLWGHSLGAVKTIRFLATQNEPRVLGAIVSSPPRFHYASFVEGETGATRAAALAHASQLVAVGRPDELVQFTLDGPMWFSARSLADKYGPEDRYDFINHLDQVSVPLMLTVGSLEGGFRFETLASKGPDLAAQHQNLAFSSIDGADHSYMSRIPQLWDLAREWLASVSPASIAQS